MKIRIGPITGWLEGLLFLITGSSVLYSCAKTSNEQLSINETKMYIRIAQVDKDGTTTYSKTVLVNRQQ